MRRALFQASTRRRFGRARSRASRLIFLAACQLPILGCGDAPAPSEPVETDTASDAAPADVTGPSYLRVRNETELDLESVRVEDTLEFGALATGAQSEYSLVEYLYGTALVEAVSGNVRLVYVPVDHVGEKQAPPGYYTYVLHPAPVEWRSPGPDSSWVRIELIADAAPD